MYATVKTFRSEESLLICSSTHAESHLNLTGSQCPATQNVSLSQQQPPWGQATGGRSRQMELSVALKSQPISQQRSHMSQARVSNFSPSINEHWQEIMQHGSTDGVIITYDIIQ